MGDQALLLRDTFQVSSELTSVYSGGPICIGVNGQEGYFNGGDCINQVDLTTGRIIKSIPITGEILAITFHPATRQLVYASSSNLLIQYQLTDEKPATFTLLRQWKGHQKPITSLDIHPSGKLIASGSTDRTARVWDLSGGFCTHHFKGHQGILSLVKFHPDEKKMQLFTCSDDHSVRVWDLVTKQCKVLNSHMSVPTSLCFSKSGMEAVSGGRDKVLNVWNLHTFDLTRTIPVFEDVESIYTIPPAFSDVLKGTTTTKKKNENQKAKKKNEAVEEEEGTLVLVAGEKGILRVFDTATASCVLTETRPDLPLQFRAIINVNREEDDEIVVVTEDQNLLFYKFTDIVSLSSSTPSTHTLAYSRLIVGSNSEIIDLKFAGKHNQTIVMASNSSQLRLFDIDTFSCNILGGHTDIIVSVDVDRTGKLITTASKDNTVKVWSVKTLKCIAEGVGHTESVGAVAFSKKTSDFICSGSQDKTIKIWNVKQVSAGASGEEIQSLKALFTTKAHDMDINSVAIAPNDMLVASASQDKLIKLWNVQGLSLVGTMRGHKRGVWSVEFSTVDRCLASSSGDKTVKIWSITDFSCLRTFEGHTSSVLKVKFLSKGMQLVSSGSDGLIKLWTIKTNQCVNTFEKHDDKVWALAVKDDGDTLLTGDGDSLLCLWSDITVIEQQKKEHEQEQLLLQQQELSNYLHQKDYRKATQLAFQLDQPYRILTIFKDLMLEDFQALQDIVEEFDDDTLAKCLSYVRDWNTNAKNVTVAQLVLQLIVQTFPPQRILKIRNIKSLIQALYPYTERHFQRLDILLQKSCIIDFTLQRMNLLTPLDEQEIEFKPTSSQKPLLLTHTNKSSASSGKAAAKEESMRDDSEEEETDSSSNSEEEKPVQLKQEEEIPLMLRPATPNKQGAGKKRKISELTEADSSKLAPKKQKTAKKQDVSHTPQRNVQKKSPVTNAKSRRSSAPVTKKSK